MVYLTYIIENYNNLSDVNIFMHSQKITWHNNAILNDDSAELISRLSGERVQREGYMLVFPPNLFIYVKPSADLTCAGICVAIGIPDVPIGCTRETGSTISGNRKN